MAIETLKVAPALRVAATAAAGARAAGAGRRSSRATAAAREAFAELRSLGEIEEGEAAVRLVHAECLRGGRRGGRRPRGGPARRATGCWPRAARIGEPSWRQRFLSDVPPNARLLALADAG